jgi:hypothetical protein
MHQIRSPAALSSIENPGPNTMTDMAIHSFDSANILRRVDLLD